MGESVFVRALVGLCACRETACTWHRRTENPAWRKGYLEGRSPEVVVVAAAQPFHVRKTPPAWYRKPLTPPRGSQAESHSEEGIAVRGD